MTYMFVNTSDKVSRMWDEYGHPKDSAAGKTEAATEGLR